MVTPCCFAELKTEQAFRTYALLDPPMASITGESTLSQHSWQIPRSIRKKSGESKIRASPMCPELDQYAVAYTSFARGGPGVSLALTKDFRSFERFGVVMSPEDKDAALLPRRIGGRWALIHRPVTTLGAHMWISYSPDLRHWGSHKIILEARRGGWWDANKIGLCSPPIETAKGMVDDLSRSAPNGLGKYLSPGLGALRSGTSGKMSAARRFLDVWSGSTL